MRVRKQKKEEEEGGRGSRDEVEKAEEGRGEGGKGKKQNCVLILRRPLPPSSFMSTSPFPFSHHQDHGRNNESYQSDFRDSVLDDEHVSHSGEQ